MEEIQVTKKFRDVETEKLHDVGETISKSNERASFLISKGYAKAIAKPETKEEKGKPEKVKVEKAKPETKEEKHFE